MHSWQFARHTTVLFWSTAMLGISQAELRHAFGAVESGQLYQDIEAAIGI